MKNPMLEMAMAEGNRKGLPPTPSVQIQPKNKYDSVGNPNIIAKSKKAKELIRFALLSGANTVEGITNQTGLAYSTAYANLRALRNVGEASVSGGNGSKQVWGLA